MNKGREPRRQTEQPELDGQALETTWARWAPFYDVIYSTWLESARRAGAAAASQVQGLILDVGVGTGLELPMFRPDARVIGVDLSEPMLRRAVHRVQRERLSLVQGLACMDAARLAFPDSSFGCALLMFVLTVTPDPAGALDEAARVIRPGGEIMVVSRISPDTPVQAAVELWIGRHFAAHLGWRPYFPWAVIGDWLAARTDMRLVERRPIGPFGLFTLARIRRTR
ncbi:MAG TPA: class I SAM-dependent methyltransferase [Methylocystis sp.]|nr:class I SAM-dependent methyltransferase [Methylocystis sp.]